MQFRYWGANNYGYKCITKHKNMRKWMVEFLSKFENRGIKIAPVITKSYHKIYQFTTVLGPF